MKLTTGTQIRYTSAAGTRFATIREVSVGPTAEPGFLNTWLLLDIPVQDGVKFATVTYIPADNGSLKSFRVELA